LTLNLSHKEDNICENLNKKKSVTTEFLYEIGDAQLWQEFKLGSEKAYAIIYKNNVSLLYNYGLKIVSDKDLIKDCIQDLFVNIWNNKENLGHVVSIKSYLFTCVRRKLILESQKNRKTVCHMDKYAVLEALSCSTEKKLIEKQNFDQQKKSLKEAIEKLTTKQKEVLHLKYNAQLSYDEITQIMTLSKKGAYKLVDRALKGLRKYMLK